MWMRILVGAALSGASLGLGACGGSDGVTLTGRVASRTLGHGESLFVWLQWWNYCGPKPWGRGGFRPVATVRVKGEVGSVRAPLREEVVPPFCNSPKFARFSVSDFGRNP